MAKLGEHLASSMVHSFGKKNRKNYVPIRSFTHILLHRKKLVTSLWGFNHEWKLNPSKFFQSHRKRGRGMAGTLHLKLSRNWRLFYHFLKVFMTKQKTRFLLQRRMLFSWEWKTFPSRHL